ncbi:MAG TPA: TetR/AcrR family transcriptional regulator [Longimicrobiales bacterium]|jgi:TetR/AcrR family fatty acid metabolism transcriptional regulator
MNVHSGSPTAPPARSPDAPPTPPAPDKEDRILQAAVRVFAEHGYYRSNMATVAREAGVATGTIYLYFERKQDLLITLFQRHLGGYIERCRPALEEAAAGAPRLRLLTELHLAFFAEDRDLATVFLIHARDPDPALAEGIGPAVAAYFDVITEVIESGMTCGAFREDLDVRLSRQVFFGALDEVVTGWVRSQRERPLMSALEPVAAMLARGFGADAEPA